MSETDHGCQSRLRTEIRGRKQAAVNDAGVSAGDLARRLAVVLAMLSLAWGTEQEDVYLTDVPDYEWHAGCFGTACGNLIGFWDRHGFPDFYTGPTAGGVAPLNSYGPNYHIRALWASQAGLDGRPADKPGHMDDYWVRYESSDPDPYLAAQRAEHTPDCIGDFTGLNQNRWKSMNGECDGNIDGYSFNYWDSTGARRLNFTPDETAGTPPRDIQSGLRMFATFRGYEADVFSQLVDVNPEAPPGSGFNFEDLVAEIRAGYPVLIMLQDPARKWQRRGAMERGNPDIHGVLAYGYLVDADGTKYVRIRTSWATGDYEFREWAFKTWMPNPWDYLPPRGVIGFHPKPKIVAVERKNGTIRIQWHAPASELYDRIRATLTKVHLCILEKATSLTPPNFQPVTCLLYTS
ncbi:MAG: hypothetical protein N3G20_05040, partial [Verrucomicrobiae bacterium]|nr:hypothetical protein [Verrucomicrobiae bacterium]